MKDILANCSSIQEKDAELIFPGAGKVESHGYQLQIQSDQVKKEIDCIKKVALKNNLAVVDESQKGSVTIFRPCFAHYPSKGL